MPLCALPAPPHFTLLQNGNLQLQLPAPAQTEAELIAVVNLARQLHAQQQQQVGGEFIMDEHLLDDGGDLDYVVE